MVVNAMRAFIEGILRSYAQILFSRSLGVGFVLVAATAVHRPSLILGLASVTLAQLVARLLGLSPEATRDGLFGYGALLIGVGGGALFGLSGTSAAFTLTAAATSVPVTAAFNAALGQGFGLPSLTLPFMAVFAGLLLAAPTLGLDVAALKAVPNDSLPTGVDAFLQSLGAIFFSPRAETGALVLAALVLGSRIAVVLGVLGFGVAFLAGQLVAFPEAHQLILGLNGIFTAIALGGIFFVPTPSAFALGGAGAVISSGIVLGLAPIATRIGLPLLILPFNLAVLLFLYALRQRMADGRPKSVDFLIGSPEENLGYYRTRLARFGARYAVRLSAPFLGRWTCTQGPDGRHTHRGPWRHGYDFEVIDALGRKHRRDGSRLEHYFCYRLPVLAPAAGTVVRIQDDIPDNPPGQQDLDQNWGNFVLVRHQLGLYALLGHLAPGSITVREGQIVRRGQILGQCGASGRAPDPHLHFQLQATDRIGAPTIAGELHDVVLERGEDIETLVGTTVPKEGDVVRNLEEVEDRARRFDFLHGQAFTLELTGARGRSTRETIVPEVDLYGNLVLRSERSGARLYYEKDDRLLTVFDAVGSRRSVLWMLRVALSRVVFEGREGFSWTDAVPLRDFTPLGLRSLLDFVSPFVPRADLEMQYVLRDDGETLVVDGRSKRSRGAQALVSTRAVIGAQGGIHRVEMTVGGRTRSATRVRADPAPTPRPAPSQMEVTT